MKELMLRYSSLGHNCEFGIAQRIHGAEPIDLLRWAITPIGGLIRMLDADFAGIDDDLSIYVSNGNYTIKHEYYNCHWHAFANPTKVDPDTVMKQHRARLALGARMLQEDLTTGRRIFVRKRENGASDSLAERLYSAMERFGRPALLYVTQGVSVGVTRIRDRLLLGSLPKFADPKIGIPATIDSENWSKLILMAEAELDQSDSVQHIRSFSHSGVTNDP
jgi:hypothetical protein